jgi:mannose-6-phosphate isomerase-like protein (cupin superfamily)
MSERMMRTVLTGLLLCIALGATAQDNGTWLELANDKAAEPADSMGLLPGETPRLGESDYLDYGQPDSLAPGVDVSSLDEFWMMPRLNFRRSRLQDLLRENMLLEEENASSVEIFRADSSMALELYQLRGEEWPHYHPLSDLWVYIWRGRGKLTLDEGESEYGPGDFLQLPAGNTHALSNLSGAPTVAIIWQWPPVVDSLVVEFIPEEVLLQMELDSLRAQDLEDRSLYKKR